MGNLLTSKEEETKEEIAQISDDVSLSTDDQSEQSKQGKQQKQYYVGIRKEDKSKWERRVSITPREVKIIRERNPNIHFIVQPSKIRIYTDKQFVKAGAEISMDLSKCETIFGVKEVPIKKMLSNKTYIYFAHVIKAQEANMPALDAVLEKNIRLIDYERIRDEKGNRLVAFGKFAGIAGTIDLLSYVGKFLLTKGYSTPFLNISMTYLYMSVNMAMQSLQMIGEMIENQGMPEEIVPFVVGITGYGRCSIGAQQVVSQFNTEFVGPDDLPKIFENPKDPKHLITIYAVIIKQEHMVQKKGAKPNEQFDKKHYYKNPHLYEPIFEMKYLQYFSIISHNMYWDYQFPKLIRLKQTKILAQEKKLRCFAIADITCDVDGSIELFKKVTTLDNPYYMIHPITCEMSDNMENMKDGILYMGVDHWPSETARDASEHFGNKLLPFIESIVTSDKSQPVEESGLMDEVIAGCICNNGKLTKIFQYIIPLRENNEKSRKTKFKSNMKKGLMKTVGSFTQVKIIGHLFDTQGINLMVDILVNFKMEFNFLHWSVGKRDKDVSQVTIQIYSRNTQQFMEVLNEINSICLKKNLEITFQSEY